MTDADTFLNGQVIVRQPAHGFRAGLDAVMLAASVPDAGEALELGAGSGTASLCLAARLPHIIVTGIEIERNLVKLANDNAAVNRMGGRVRFAEADVFALPPEWKREYECVLINPPFHGAGQAPADATRARAMMDHGRLADWLMAGLKRTVPGGHLTTILKADRLGEAVAVLPQAGLRVFPLWPKRGEPAVRALLQIRKASRAPFRLLPGLILHEDDGTYTEQADRILRGHGALALAEPPL